ncbi:MAG: hypothetical protein SCALA702_00730 [Melioribacteraceae bacterium]|nr:MAG: hypothetical protein SCALA702_00730 [Melioribacteraceae bacterium]
MSVVGFGPDRLINEENPIASENRRVEIRIIQGGVNNAIVNPFLKKI